MIDSIRGKSRFPSGIWPKALVFLLCLLPFAYLSWSLWRDTLGPNPIEAITRGTGDWTLRFLVITLAVTPLRKILGLPKLIAYRRMLGLFAFFYGFLHLITYVWLDQFFDAGAIAKDIVKRPFIAAGSLGFLLMVPLAVTSTAGWIRRLGGRRWQFLHRLAYLSAAAGVLHFYWMAKFSRTEPLIYAAILAILMAFRAGAWLLEKRRFSATHFRSST